MFKLESYITPILLDYVAKYVKNLREEDAQVSLWEGEATFHNLDMRLDVLEEEFNLPIELVSGHIHDLTIQVPWHRLTSEPTRIIINTIEFVAKLPSNDASSQHESPTSTANRSKSPSSENTSALPTGSGMVSKIINNISVECHNIILKYVEDDIVVSMNVQLLKFGSASEAWLPAMVDVHPVKVVMRKLLNISDLTICLDKRNSAGRIDVCQEPLLYRCTLECRLLHKYNINTVKTSSTMRIGLFTKSMDINVSSLQFPMVMRLVKLLLSLRPSNVDETTAFNDTETRYGEDENRRVRKVEQSRNTSYFTWALNWIPTFDYLEQPSGSDSNEVPGHVLDIGVYAEELNFQLKNSEYIVDPMMGGMKRIRYTPIMRISLGGIYYERSTLKECDWANVKAGLSSICVEPLGTYRTDDQRENKLVNTAAYHDRAFVDKSLFDEHYVYAERTWSTTNYEDYTSRITDEYMLYRSPVLAFDVVEFRAIKNSSNTSNMDPTSGAQSSKVPAASASGRHEQGGMQVQYRLLSAGITFHYSQSFLQVKNVIRDFINSYDYPEYSNAEVDPRLATMNKYTTEEYMFEELEQVMSHGRVCNYRFELRNMVIQFHARHLPNNANPGNRISTAIKQSLPVFELKLAHAEGHLCTSLNGQQIVDYAIRLNDRPREVMDVCYDIYKFNAKNLTVSLLNTNVDRSRTKLLSMPKLNVVYNKLLFPQKWIENGLDAAIGAVELNCDAVTLDFSKRELVISARLLALLFEYKHDELLRLSSVVKTSSKSADVIKLQTHLTKMRINTRRYNYHFNFVISVRTLTSEVYHTMMQMRSMIISTTKGSQSKWFELQLQLPYGEEPIDEYENDDDEDPNNQKTALSTVVGVWIEPFRFTVDVFLLQFLSWKEIRKMPNAESLAESELNIASNMHQNVSSNTMISNESGLPNSRKILRITRKVSQPEETVHVSSERDSKLDAEPNDQRKTEPFETQDPGFFVRHIEFFKRLVVVVEVAESKIQIAEIIVRRSKGEIINEYSLIRLPVVNIRSMHGDVVVRSNIRSKITVPLETNSCSWTINLYDMSLKYRKSELSEDIISPIRTTIIIALSHKSVNTKKVKKVEEAAPTTKKSIEINPNVGKVKQTRSSHHAESDDDRYSLTSERSVHRRVEWNPNEPHKDDKEVNDKNRKNILSINLHIDTSEIRMSGRRLKTVHEHIKIFLKAIDLFSTVEHAASVVNAPASQNNIQVLTATEECPYAKEFLDMESIASDEPRLTYDEDLDIVTFIVFCQWTIPNITLEIESLFENKLRKVVFEMEDLLLNVDKHSDYIKFTSKIESMSLNYYEATSSANTSSSTSLPIEWTTNDYLRIRILTDNTNMPLLSIIVTTVNLKNLHSRIGVKAQSAPNRVLSEILISVLPLELILDLDQIAEFLLPLCELFDIMKHNRKSATTSESGLKASTSNIIPVCDLPMIHMDLKGLTVYIPTNTGKPDCTVLSLKVSGISITPNLDNPLQRNPVRPDLYNKAAELGLLATPGAIIEDRQYELCIQNISLDSGNWINILEYLREEAKRDQMNPAVEWNNQTPKPEIKMENIFNNFTFNSIFAPAITFNKVLVCGQSVEYNCATDFVATINTHQINLFSCILLCIKHISSITELTCTTAKLAKANSNKDVENNSSLETIPSSYVLKEVSSMHLQSANSNHSVKSTKEKPFFEARDSNTMSSIKSDSGWQSASGGGNDQRIAIPSKYFQGPQQPVKRNVPQTISFVAGIFVVNVFDAVLLPKENIMLYSPVISFTISQPNFMFTQNIYDTVHHASVFNFSVNIPSKDSIIKIIDANDKIYALFSETLIDTSPGDVNSSGIPPPLVSYKSHIDRLQYREVDIDLNKPIVIKCRETSVLKTTTSLMRIYATVLSSPCFPVRSQTPIVRCSKLRQLQLQCMSANRLHLSIEHVTLKFFDDYYDYKCWAICRDFVLNIKFRNHPEKASLKGSLGAFYMKINQKVILHPVVLRFSTDLISESWAEQPLVNASLKVNVLHFDLGIHMLLQLREVHLGLLRCLNHFRKEWQDYLHRRPTLGVNQLKNKESLHQLKAVNSQKIKNGKQSKSSTSKEEFYQDDLRAGAFQFVDLNTDSVLPMPYQIQIIKKNFGIICWRYPQPRCMTRIDIYPVPMPVNNPIQIRCRMEYFSEVHENFLYFCDFLLSETATREVKLPEREICANIWRVVILQSLISVNGECFEPSEEDDDLHSIASMKIDNDMKNETDNDFILHPKVLVGCMRIDTTFQAKHVPAFQILFHCNNIIINLLNQPAAKVKIPIVLKDYAIQGMSLNNQIFLAFEMERLNLLFNFYNNNNGFAVEASAVNRIKCLDYGFINMLDVLEPMTFQSYIRVNSLQRTIIANFLVDKLRINMGPSIMHSILSSKVHWAEVLRSDEDLNTLIPKCVIVNRTQIDISFGQSGTRERITLKPKQCQLYHFNSDFYNQELTFFVFDEETQRYAATETLHIPLKFEGKYRIRYLRIGETVLIIKMGKMSSTQIFILLKGQIELISMVTKELYVELRPENENAATDDKNLVDYHVDCKGRSNWYIPLQRGTEVSMRLKLSNGKGKGRTGDIPLKQNNSLPWLVKIPNLPSQQFISVWVRVMREDLPMENSDSFQPQRILIQIWPIFEICNMLSLQAHVSESTTEEKFVIQGSGGRYMLETPTTHLTEHNLTFDYGVNLGSESQNSYNLMLKSVDWHKFFHYDENEYTIESSLRRLSQTQKICWPMNDEEELRVQRHFNQDNNMDVIYTCQATRENSCTMGLQILPWGTFINATGLDISINIQGQKNRMLLRPNSLNMLTAIKSGFTIDITYGTNWVSSLPIYLSDIDLPSSNVKYLALQPNTNLDICIIRMEEVINCVLTLKIENQRKIFKLRSKYVVANFSNVQLNVLALALGDRERSDRYGVQIIDKERINRILCHANHKTHCVGESIDIFNDINARKSKRFNDTPFALFMCLQVEKNSDFSMPIALSTPFTRRCLSIQDGSDSVPLAITYLENDGIYYLSIFRDTQPGMIISNHTNLKFIVAQTSASENSIVTNTTPEYSGKHFEWYQHVCPKSKCYYTPPLLYANFPDVDFTVCNLTLAVYIDDVDSKKKISWSKPIRTDKTWKKFLRVPSHGDVKVVVCDKHRVIKVSIYYVSQQMEFLVKDLRSRLQQPQEYYEPSNTEDTEGKTTQIAKDNEDDDDSAGGVMLKSEHSECAHFSQECSSKYQMKACLFVKKIVFSLQADNVERDYMKTEVCNVYVDDIALVCTDNDDERQLIVQIPNLQVDNQLFSTGKYDFPVVLCAEQTYRRTVCLPQIYTLYETYRAQSAQNPIGLITFNFYQEEYSLNSIHCKFSPFRMYIEDAYINQLLEALLECEPSNCVYTNEKETKRLIMLDGQTLLPESVVDHARWIADPLELRSFVIEPLVLLLSVHTSLRLYIALDHSPLSFSRYERRQILTTPIRFGQSLGMHYLSGAIFGAGWVVGSLEILGSPSALARSFTIGLRDFISMPVQGLLRGPWGFILGITQGSASLLRNVTAGTVNSVTKLASSVARNIDRLTLDEEHIERTEAMRRLRPQGFADGLTQGMTGLGISILGAVGGLAHHTLDARNSVDILAGLTKGIVGAFTKPISGAAEMLALAGQGMLQTVGFNAMPEQLDATISRNAAVHPSCYRIWQILPTELHSDQILFYHHITLVTHEQLRPAYVFLTSAVVAIMEADQDILTFVSPVDRVELVVDREDRSKYYLHFNEPGSEDAEETNYTNHRIMKFLTTSRNDFISSESLNELLNPSQNSTDRHTDWVYFINENMGEHLMHYLKVLHK